MVRRLLSIATLYPNAENPRFGTFVARSLEALAARGDWDVTVINPIGVPPIRIGRYANRRRLLGRATENGVDVHRIGFPLIPRFGAWWNPRAIARAGLPLAGRLHAERPFDLVDAQFFFPDGPAAARIASAIGLPLAIKARGADIHQWGARPGARRQIVKAAEQAAGLLAVSQGLADDMAGLGLPRDRITVHHTGLDRDRFRPLQHEGLRSRLGGELGIDLPPGDPLFACVGALIPRKGQEFAIAALTEIPEARLLLVGMGDDEPKLRRLAARLGLSERVHFLGAVDHDLLPVILSATDAMVLPSASEGLANAWVEALACGAPLVICDAGAARNVVTAPEAGRIVARNSSAIAAALSEVLAARYPPEVVAAHAARFSWEAHAEALAAIYEGILAA